MQYKFSFLLLLFAVFPGARVYADVSKFDLSIDTNVVRDVRKGASFTFQIYPGLPAYTFKLIADSQTNTIQKIEIYLPDAKQPKQILQAGQSEAPYRDSDYFKAVDIDFDGYQDIALLNWWGATGNEGWQFWRFVPASGKFVEDPVVSALGRPQFDAKTQTIEAFSKGGWCHFTTTTYAYKQGKLIPQKEKQCTPPAGQPSAADCDCKTVQLP